METQFYGPPPPYDACEEKVPLPSFDEYAPPSCEDAHEVPIPSCTTDSPKVKKRSVYFIFCRENKDIVLNRVLNRIREINPRRTIEKKDVLWNVAEELVYLWNDTDDKTKDRYRDKARSENEDEKQAAKEKREAQKEKEKREAMDLEEKKEREFRMYGGFSMYYDEKVREAKANQVINIYDGITDSWINLSDNEKKVYHKKAFVKSVSADISEKDTLKMWDDMEKIERRKYYREMAKANSDAYKEKEALKEKEENMRLTEMFLTCGQDGY